MKQYKVVILLFALFAIISSCNKETDDEEFANEKNKVTFKVSCSNPESLMRITSHGGVAVPAYGNYEDEFITKGEGVTIIVRCDDENAVLIVEAYVNDKLSIKRQALKFLELGIKVK